MARNADDLPTDAEALRALLLAERERHKVEIARYDAIIRALKSSRMSVFADEGRPLGGRAAR